MMDERKIILMEKYFDASLSSEEEREFENIILHDEKFKVEFEEQKRIKEVLNKMNLKNPTNEFWDAYWLGLYNKFERSIAWLFISIGAIIVFAYSAFIAVEKFLADTTTPGIVKWGSAFLVFGFLFLLYSIIREKLTVSKKDKYKEIQR